MIKKIAKKKSSFSLILRVILSTGAMLIFSVLLPVDHMPVGMKTLVIGAYKELCGG